jgi:hypothetical protein
MPSFPIPYYTPGIGTCPCKYDHSEHPSPGWGGGGGGWLEDRPFKNPFFHDRSETFYNLFVRVLIITLRLLYMSRGTDDIVSVCA